VHPRGVKTAQHAPTDGNTCFEKNAQIQCIQASSGRTDDIDATFH